MNLKQLVEIEFTREQLNDLQDALSAAYKAVISDAKQNVMRRAAWAAEIDDLQVKVAKRFAGLSPLALSREDINVLQISLERGAMELAAVAKGSADVARLARIYSLRGRIAVADLAAATVDSEPFAVAASTR